MKSAFGVMVVFVALLFAITFQAQAKGTIEQKTILPLIEMDMRPSAPTTGDDIYGFLRLTTSFNPADEVNVFLEVTLDTAPLSLRHPTGDYWFFETEPLTEGFHDIGVTVFVEDKVEADAVRSAITALELEISDIEAELLIEEDPGQIAILEAQLASKNSQKEHFGQILEGLRTELATETFTFEVIEEVQ